MMEITQQPRRMRFSWESRCRIVVLIESGMSPQAAAAACGASRATGVAGSRVDAAASAAAVV
jgi:hypothetical protein